jgi:metal transporter CNNM
MERARRFYDPLICNIPSAIAFFGLALLVLLLSAELIGLHSPWMDWVSLVLLASFSGVFGGLQFGITKPYLGVVKAQAKDRNAAAVRALPIIKRATVIRYSLMVAATMMGVKISTLTDKLMPATVAFLFSSVVLVVCGEILPSKFFTQDSVRKVAGLAPFIWLCHWILGPLTQGTNWVVNLVLPDKPEALIEESALSGLVAELAREEALTGISPLEAKMIRSVLLLDDLSASEEANPVHPDNLSFG